MSRREGFKSPSSDADIRELHVYILFQPKVLKRNANRREYFRTSIVQYINEKRTRRPFRDVFRMLPRFLLNKIANVLKCCKNLRFSNHKIIEYDMNIFAYIYTYIHIYIYLYIYVYIYIYISIPSNDEQNDGTKTNEVSICC